MNHATKLFMAAVATIMLLSSFLLTACGGGSSSKPNTSPSLVEQNNGDLILEEDSRTDVPETTEGNPKDYYGNLIDDSIYQSYYDGWIHDEGQFRMWIDSGQQPEECMAAIDEWCYEIQSFNLEEVPEKYRSLHTELTGEAQRFRDEARMTLGY